MAYIYTSKALVSGIWTPGFLRQPKGASIKRNLDERVGYGVDFAFVVFTGRKLARFSTELVLPTKADRDEHEIFQQRLMHVVPRRGAVQQSSNGYDAARAMSIWHPQLIPLEITQCIVEDEPQIEWDDYNCAHVTYQFCQVKPTPAAGYAKPEAAAPKPPMTADEAEIDRLRKQNDAKRQANEAAGK